MSFDPVWLLLISKVVGLKLNVTWYKYMFFSVREKLQDIMQEKKNRKWSILEALKDVMNSITTRFRGASKSGVSLDKVVDLLEDHEVGEELTTPEDDVGRNRSTAQSWTG